MTDPTNGGRRINHLERSDAVQDTKLDMLVKQTAQVHAMLTQALPQIVRNEERIGSNRGWIKSLWTLGGALLLMSIKVAFFK